MLKKLETADAEWTAADNKKLEKLTKIVGVLTKLLPMEEKSVTKRTVIRKEDQKIISRYLERNLQKKK